MTGVNNTAHETDTQPVGEIDMTSTLLKLISVLILLLNVRYPTGDIITDLIMTLE